MTYPILLFIWLIITTHSETFPEYENENAPCMYDYENTSKCLEWIAVVNLRSKKKGKIPSTHVVADNDKIRSKP